VNKMNTKTTALSRIAALSALSLLSLAACGGGSSGLATADLTDKMDTICKQVTDDMDALEPPTDAKGAASFFADALKISLKGTADLKALKAGDKADADNLKEMVSSLEDSNDITKDLIAAAKDEDDAAGEKAYGKYQSALEDAAASADKMGAKECADIGSSGDDEAATDATEPAPVETQAPVETVAPVDTQAPVETAAPIAGPVVEPIDLSSIINAPEGYELALFEGAQLDSVVSSVAAAEGAADLIAGVGAGSATNAAGINVVIGVQLRRELSAAETDEFLKGVTETSVDVTEATVDGLTGLAFQEADGMFGFTTVVGTTAFLVLSADVEQLQAIMTALVAANA
jgi:hypothetical protein